MSTKMVLRESNKYRFNKITKTLQGIVSNVLGLSKSNGNNDFEVRLKVARLKKERLQALALVAESQAVLAETEVMLAELELNQELKDLKRKNPSDDDGSNPKRTKISVEKNTKTKTSSEKRPQSTKHTEVLGKPRKSSTPKPTSPRRQRKDQHSTAGPHDETLVIARDNAVTSTEKCKRGKPAIILNNPPLRNVSKNNLGYISSTKQMVEFHRTGNKYNPLYNIPCYPTSTDKASTLNRKDVASANDPKNLWQDSNIETMVNLLNKSMDGSKNLSNVIAQHTQNDVTRNNLEIVKVEVVHDESSRSLDRLIMDLEE